jgi:nicotinamide-nucleotide amidase
MGLKQEILKYSRQENMTPLTQWFDAKLEELLDSGIYSDLNTLEDTGQKLVKGLVDYRKKYGITNVALGMSGGVDSALTASMFKTAGWKVTGLTMPIHQNPDETARGIEACKVLGIEHKHIDLTKTFDSLLKDVAVHDKDINNEDQALRRGNLRVRLRMMTVYNEASALKGLVGSTDNFSELAAGFWTLHGDVGDLAPIQSLTKSWEVPRLAEIYGVPESTVFATPTDGLGIANGDEDQFGFSYLEFDIILMSLCNLTRWDTRSQILAQLEVPGDELDRANKILDRIKMSAFKRRNPFNLEHPLHVERYPGLSNTDLALWAPEPVKSIRR